MVNNCFSDSVRSVQQAANAIRENVARVMIGKLDVIDLLLVALLATGIFLSKMCQAWEKRS